GSIEQLVLLVDVAQEINGKVNRTDDLVEATALTNNITNSTKALVHGSIEQLALLVDLAQEINRKVNITDEIFEVAAVTNNITSGTKALVHGSIEQLALLVDVTQEIKKKVNNAQINELLSHITNVTHINNALAWDHTEALFLIETLLNNNTDLLITLAASNNYSLTSFVNTFSNIQDTSTSTAGVVDDILLVVQELLQLHNVSSPLPTSCKQIRYKKPNSPSGMYLLATVNGTINAYCNMEELCGSGGGWTRLAYLDMSDSTVNCPSGFRLYQFGGVRVCGRAVASSGSCVSVQFPSNGISYSQVCGRVTGYQYGSPDGNYPDSSHNDINSYYVDGVSITRGFPRQHVWTLIAGLGQEVYPSYSANYYNCPCSPGSLQNSTLQSFMGNNYFCESGNSTDPLWD
uniref:Fibrinogen C-terminal domain-containing protein n=1 Tax=Amphimedon queenslandica TaxID=400682 RepID=A0A1X7USW5_AMPQE